MLLWEEIRELSVAELTDRADTEHLAATFAQSGGTRISDSALQGIRAELIGVAENLGFPGSSTPAARARLDDQLAATLDSLDIPRGEGFRSEVWSFLTMVTLPDLARWRFPRTEDASRFIGGNRNTFKRLWDRALWLKEPESDRPFRLVEELSEDALVQITERPGLAANPALARGLARGWIRLASRIGRGKMEDPARKAILTIRATLPVINLDALSEGQLQEAIDDAYSDAAQQFESDDAS